MRKMSSYRHINAYLFVRPCGAPAWRLVKCLDPLHDRPVFISIGQTIIWDVSLYFPIGLKDEEIEYVCDTVRKGLSR